MYLKYIIHRNTHTHTHWQASIIQKTSPMVHVKSMVFSSIPKAKYLSVLSVRSVRWEGRF